MNILKFQVLKSVPSLKVDDPNQILSVTEYKTDQLFKYKGHFWQSENQTFH